ncbi:MAG: hypothetical protein MK160_08575 [Rhodobacteraceae bacterium]|nr:hypothetical protein [Paracoccaceae bacterium]
MVRLFFILLLLGGQVSAGAWPRDKGTWFGSTAIRFAWPRGQWPLEAPAQYYTLYMEYGLTDQVTLGLDAGRSVSGAGKTILFARYPIRNRNTGLKVGAELGAGRIDGAFVIRPGLSLGYGFAAKRGSGWISVDTVAEMTLETSNTDFKADITYGRSMPNGTKWILQLQSGKPANQDMFLRFAPSLVIDLKKGRMFEVGATIGAKNDSEIGLKIGMWHHF